MLDKSGYKASHARFFSPRKSHACQVEYDNDADKGHTGRFGFSVVSKTLPLFSSQVFQ
jgi:hypothetical protein